MLNPSEINNEEISDENTSVTKRNEKRNKSEISVTKRNILDSTDEDYIKLLGNVTEITKYLIKGGCEGKKLETYMKFYLVSMFPYFTEEQVDAEIFELKKLAYELAWDGQKSLTDDLSSWVMETSGSFTNEDYYKSANISKPKDKTKARVVLGRLVEKGIIERVGNKNGVFRMIESKADEIDFINADVKEFMIKWPFKIEYLVKTHPKNIIIIAGEQNAGKTALLLNTAKLNMNQGHDIYYYSSEMGAVELKDRLSCFDGVSLEDWKAVKFLERSNKFSDIIKPNAINIIDYLEITDNFYLIGSELRAIHERLENGIAIIGLQKDGKSVLGRGSSFGLEKPRLYITLQDDAPNGAIITLKKAKNWKDKSRNPNGLESNFKIRNGCDLYQTSDWDYPKK